MKVMLLVMDKQRVILDHLYESIQQHCASCVIYRLDSTQQRNLGNFLASVSYQAYDRVVIFTRVKRQISQLGVLRCIPGLVFIEHDACQNYMTGSKYHGTYSRLYKCLPWARVLVSGYGVSQKLQAEGVDAIFISKGYDEQMLKDLAEPRDIAVAFLGSLNSSTYSERKAMLNSIAGRTNLRIIRTESGQEYLAMLNRIQIFISADVGMGEYMIKNFEAMACGCTLLTWSQGEQEDAAIGFIDMDNVVLYRSADEAVEKISWLKNNPRLAQEIASRGKVFVENKFGFSRVGQDIANALTKPMRPWPGVGRLLRNWVRFRYNMKVS